MNEFQEMMKGFNNPIGWLFLGFGVGLFGV